MTTFTTTESGLEPRHARTAVARRARCVSERSPFTEVREQARMRALMVAATTTGIVSVTAAASAAVVVIGLGA
ncbi:hypothetical protein [Curtobacterium aurantiacum]|uniref:hypothetical protein n=1 Tax=Curtobacterium aurantiacum TaxID=3236919 RepID=UPI001BDFDB71|nr:hypothetical protein [Curtobacterium flaccumfaciens]MBT1675594.1 hypothetical protein [Curtobacterium flaccumfaciens pv. flaccumfaciens]